MPIRFNGNDQYVSMPVWEPTTNGFSLRITITFVDSDIGSNVVLLGSGLSKNSDDRLVFTYLAVDGSEQAVVLDDTEILPDVAYRIRVGSSENGVTLSANSGEQNNSLGELHENFELNENVELYA